MATEQDRYLARLRKKIGPFLDEFAKADIREREAVRCTAATERLVEFHRLIGEELDPILEVLDQYPPDGIPEPWQNIANAVLFLAEIDSPVVKWVPRWGLAHLPDALDPRHFESKRNFYDVEPAGDRSLMAERIR